MGLLSRGSQVRVLLGAPISLRELVTPRRLLRLLRLRLTQTESCWARHFLKNSAILPVKKMHGEGSSNRMTGLASLRHISTKLASTNSLSIRC